MRLTRSELLLKIEARNTFENLLWSKPLLPDERIGIVTNEFHSIRTSFSARRIGIKHIILGASSPRVKRYKWELREHLAIIKSWILDKEN